MFGHRAGTNISTPDKKSLEVAKAVFDAFECETKLVIGFPFHRYIKTPVLRKFFRSLDVLSNFTFNFMEKIKNSPSSLTDGHECLFEKFKREKKLTDDEINQLAITLLAGGVDTTSTMLVSTLFKLSKSQTAQAKLYEEINRVLPNGHTPTSDHLSKMPYLKATINEVFRTNPVTPATVRQLSRPIVLGGYEIPAGVTIALSSGYMSTQVKKEVFGELDGFKPERWLRGSKDFHPFASLPFGFGPRMCVGRRIAQMELWLFLVRFLQKFKVEDSHLPEDQLGWIFGVVQRPDRPVNFCFTARSR
jgi:cytochrome P450